MRIRDRIKELPRHPTKVYRTRDLARIDTVIVHHSATAPTHDNAYAFARYHVDELNWAGVGYHYVVNPDGSVDHCHPASTISNHAAGVNTRSIGVCLAGNFDNVVPPPEQWGAAVELIGQLMGAYPSVTRILGHREVPNTHKTCPGRKFDMNRLRADIANRRG